MLRTSRRGTRKAHPPGADFSQREGCTEDPPSSNPSHSESFASLFDPTTYTLAYSSTYFCVLVLETLLWRSQISITFAPSPNR